jgi:hypothetical protein
MAAAAAGSGDPPAKAPIIQEIDIPILKGLSPAKNGTIHLMGQNIEGKGWDNIFSFIYYYKRLSDNKEFYETVYHDGLLVYILMVHGEEFVYPPLPEEGNKENGGGANGGSGKNTKTNTVKRETAKLPANTGMIVYTDWPTLELLKGAFTLEDYPNLIYAVPEWPYYSDKEVLRSDILRTMRYHAVELFPSLNVHIRDADTLFTAYWYESTWDWAKFKFLTTAWETTYLTKFIPEMEKQDKQIVIGASSRYSAFYHSNIPYPVEFTFPIRKPYEKEVTKNPYKHIYVRSNFYTKENRDKLYELRYGAIPKEEGENYNTYSERQRALRAKQVENFKAGIPPERRELIPYYNHFTKNPKYMYLRGSNWFGEVGVLAGFSSVLKNRKGIEDFWKKCVEYLVSRYYMAINPETGEALLTDEAFEEIFILQGTGKPFAKKIYGFGKDERMLLYGIVPEYFSTIYFFDIRYFKYLSQYESWKDKEFLEPNYPEKILEHNNYEHKQLVLSFKPFVKHYLKWQEDIKKEFPTQKNFLNAIESNFQARLVPFNTIMAETPKNLAPYEGQAEPYKEFAKYGRLTFPGKLEGGRRRKTRRNIKASKRKTRGKRN